MKRRLLLGAAGIMVLAQTGILFRLGYALRVLWERYKG